MVEPKEPQFVRSKNVVMGKQDFTSVLLRAIGGELYKIQRRPLPKLLLLIGIVFIVLGFGVISIGTLFTTSSSVENYLPPRCNGSSSSIQGQCLNHAPTQHDLAKAEQAKQQDVKAATAPLYLPGSLSAAVNLISFIGVILLIILAGTIVGGEYNVGSIRIMLTRGPTRTQFLLAKIGTMLICSLFTLIVLTLVGIITGALLNLPNGSSIDFKFLTGAWVLHSILFLLAAVFTLLLYSVLAICLSTLGKTTVAGVAGALMWWFLERILGSALEFFSLSNKGPFGDFLRAVPDYLIANNISALLNNQEQYMSGGSAGSISDLHAVLVLIVYLGSFIGIAWVSQTRDITN
jgi:ABC-type transport system involved in multi-copper enzyme maturation permease subunit